MCIAYAEVESWFRQADVCAILGIGVDTSDAPRKAMLADVDQSERAIFSNTRGIVENETAGRGRIWVLSAVAVKQLCEKTWPAVSFTEMVARELHWVNTHDAITPALSAMHAAVECLQTIVPSLHRHEWAFDPELQRVYVELARAWGRNIHRIVKDTLPPYVQVDTRTTLEGLNDFEPETYLDAASPVLKAFVETAIPVPSLSNPRHTERARRLQEARAVRVSNGRCVVLDVLRCSAHSTTFTSPLGALLAIELDRLHVDDLMEKMSRLGIGVPPPSTLSSQVQKLVQREYGQLGGPVTYEKNGMRYSTNPFSAVVFGTDNWTKR